MTELSIEGELLEAIEAGQVLRVVYFGGSQPGSVREISPIAIKDGILRARCHSSNAVKTFATAKLVIQSEANVSPSIWNPGVTLVHQYETIGAFLDAHKDWLISIGWHIEHTPTNITLHRLKKNGTPLKTSDVSFYFVEYSSDLVMSFDDGEFHFENVKKRLRPWVVRGKGKETRSFGNLNKASVIFLEYAKSLVPAAK